MNGHLSGGFNIRDLKRCANCGSSYPFFEMSEDYVDHYGSGGDMDAWLYPADIDDPVTKDQSDKP